MDGGRPWMVMAESPPGLANRTRRATSVRPEDGPLQPADSESVSAPGHRLPARLVDLARELPTKTPARPERTGAANRLYTLRSGTYQLAPA